VLVLAAGQKIQPDEQGRPEKVNVVTLLCAPEDAAKVTLAASEGRIQLVLRNPTDTLKTEKETTVARSALYGKFAVPVAAPVVRKPKPELPPVVVAEPVPPAPPTTGVIEMIRGEKIAKVEVPLL
jgi:Flp pilus assembly protein CpaB